MPDPDPSSSPAGTTGSQLPVPASRPTDTPRQHDSENVFTRLLRTLVGWKSGSLRANLEDVLEAGGDEETGFSPDESKLLRNILDLRERRVVDVMIPRADIVAVQHEIPIGELLKVFENAAHSRLVVYKDTLDDAVGMVHIRDLIAFMTARAAEGAAANTRRRKPLPAGLDLKAIDLAMPLAEAQIAREMLFVPPSMPAMDLMARMQARRIHLALVIDEYGGADGLVSIEDIVEQIVGEIDDEHDDEEVPDVVPQADGAFVADARAALEDVVSIVGPDFEIGDAADEVDTLGGYLFSQIGRVPVRGELVPGPGPYEIEVLDADPRRAKMLRISRRTTETEAVAALPPPASDTQSDPAAPDSLPPDAGGPRP